jgi:hypothetical protein
MAEKKVQIDIIIETANAARSVKSITDSIVELKDAMKTVGEGSDDFKKLDTKAKQLESSLEGVASATKKTDTNSKKAGKSIGGLALDIAKGISIAKLFEAGIGKLTNSFSSNQQGADLLATASGALNIVMGEVVKVLFDSAEEVGKTSNGFQALGTLLKSSFLVIINTLKLSFFGIKLALQEIRLAWEESFFGDEDPATIERLNKAINETELQIVLAGEAIVDNGKKVVDNFIPAITSVVDFTAKVIEGVSKISVAGAIEQSKANVELKNSSELAAKEASKLATTLEGQAEKQRQIRDDEFLSIEDRKKANNELAIILKKQEEALLKEAEANIDVAKSEIKIIDNAKTKGALLDAEKAKEQVLADIAGKFSEQKQNDVALTREELELKELIAAGEVERAGKQKEFAIAQERNLIRQLELTKESLVLQRDDKLILLQDKINTYKEGTTARAEAEQEFLNKKQEFDNKIVETDKQLVIKRDEVAKSDAVAKAKREVIQSGGSIKARQALLDAEKAQILSNTQLTEEQRLEIEAEFDAKSAELQRERIKRLIANGQELVSISSEITRTIGSNRQTDLEIEQINLEADYERRKALIEKNVTDEKERAKQIAVLDEAVNKSRNEIEKRKIELEKQGIKRERNITIASIALSTAAAIANASVASIKSDPVSFALSIAANVATVVATIAKANSALKKADAASAAIGAGGGGGGGGSPLPSSSSESTSQAQTPNAFALFGAGGNANNLGGPNGNQLIQAYVVESDISSVQRRVERFRTASEL